jgi:hypothetical protein
MTDYSKRAEECRRLAELRADTAHWPAFLEMAETWEMLGRLNEYCRELRSSGVPLHTPPAGHKNL